MKKLLTLCLSIMFMLSIIVFTPACKKTSPNDGFEVISEISFTSNGKNITKTSTAYQDTYKTMRTITKNEFVLKATEKKQAETENKNVDFKVEYLPISAEKSKVRPSSSETFLKKIKENVSSKAVNYLNESNDNTIYYVAYYTQLVVSIKSGSGNNILDNCVRFEVCQREGTYYFFVLVKILDNQTIQIADEYGITTYTVTSYTVKYLDNTLN